MKVLKETIILVGACGLMACSGSNSSSNGENNPRLPIEPFVASGNGQFIDSPVQGLSYRTFNELDNQTSQGTTDSNGAYSYNVETDSEIEFSIGNLTLGRIAVSDIITPLSFSNESSDLDLPINLARFIQTLDDDQNPENGINIDNQTIADINTTYSGIPAIDFDQPSDDFVSSVEQNLGLYAPSSTLISADDAATHLNATLNNDDSYQLDLEGTTWTGTIVNLRVYNFDEDTWVFSHACGELGQVSLETYRANAIDTEIADLIDSDECTVGGQLDRFSYTYNENSLCPNVICSLHDLNRAGVEFFDSEDNRHEQISKQHAPGSDTVLVTKTITYRNTDFPYRHIISTRFEQVDP